MAKSRKKKPIRKLLGAHASPRHCLAGASPHRVTAPYPAQFGIVPKTLNAFGNDRYGDCVSAEEAYAICVSSIMAGMPQVCPTAAEVIAFARDHGFLNGADLCEVMDAMQKDGMVVGGKTYHDGPYNSVNWEDRAELSSALATGPIKIGVAAGQLMRVTGGSNGWFLTGASKSRNIDHSVPLCGYGPMSYLAGLCGVSVPKGVDGNAYGYLLGTWGTVGVIEEASMRAITGEAWLRHPTIVEFPNVAPVPIDPPEPPPLPPPGPGPTPNPTPVPGDLDSRWAAVSAEVWRREAAGDGDGAERIVQAAERAAAGKFAPAPCGGPVRDISERFADFLDGVQPAAIGLLTDIRGMLAAPNGVILANNAVKLTTYGVTIMGFISSLIATIPPKKQVSLAESIKEWTVEED